MLVCCACSLVPASCVLVRDVSVPVSLVGRATLVAIGAVGSGMCHDYIHQLLVVFVWCYCSSDCPCSYDSVADSKDVFPCALISTQPDAVEEALFQFWVLFECRNHVLHCLSKLAEWSLWVLLPSVEVPCVSVAVNGISVEDVGAVPYNPCHQWVLQVDLSVVVLLELCP